MLDGIRHRVGILDDNDDSRAVLRFWLEMQGFDVLEYSRVEDFLRGIGQDQLDLALVDLWLPDGSGMTVPSEVGNGGGSKIPFVAVTAHAMPGVLQETTHAGFCGFVTKPLDFEELALEIQKHLPLSAI